MRHLRPIVLSTFIVISLILGIGNTPLSGVDISDSHKEPIPGLKYYRVYYENIDTAHQLVMSMTTVETKYEKGFVIVEIANSDEYKRLLETGLKIKEIRDPLKDKREAIERAAPLSTEAIPNYPCYRTVEETFATAQSIAATYPTLATWTDVGDSWEKTNSLGGYDMMVLKLTNSAITGSKPKIFLTGAIHAREYTTAELLTRYAELLVSDYGTDPDITWLLDHHEIHMMLQANPDGRKKAETGLSWRKNTNQNYCSPTSNYRGADLNRNFPFKWACCGGSSSYECDTTYHGASAASEPETQAVRDYMLSQFPDQRGPGDLDAAPLDTTGIYLDIHASGKLILWPWGWTSDQAPNHIGLQTLGRKMAYFNDHTPKQGVGLYPTDGTTKLFGYGELGIPAYTVELGTQFFESCSYFESTIVPDNIQTLLYASKVTRTPYMTPFGPDALNLALSAGSTSPGIAPGTAVTLTASINDTRFNNSNGTEPTQNIAAAEYYVDNPPWVTSPTPVAFAMSPSDGSFNNTVENAEASIDTTGWSEGRHIVFVRGQDTDGNWGAFSAVFLFITNTSDTTAPTPDPMTFATAPYATGQNSIQMTATTATDTSGVEYYFECTTPGGHDSGWQDSTTYVDSGLSPDTTYTYRVKARDKSSNQNETAWSTSLSATTDPLPEWTELTYDDFESGFGNYTDGGRNCTIYTKSIYAHQGSNAVNIQASGTIASFYHTNGIDIDTPAYTELKIEFWFKFIGMEPGEGFIVEYYNGSTWQTIGTYTQGTYSNDTFYNPTITITESTHNFPTNMKLRFQNTADDKKDDSYIDEIKLSAK